METITIPMERFLRMEQELKRLRELEKVDFDLVKQFKEGLEDLREGKIRRVA